MVMMAAERRDGPLVLGSPRDTGSEPCKYTLFLTNAKIYIFAVVYRFNDFLNF